MNLSLLSVNIQNFRENKSIESCQDIPLVFSTITSNSLTQSDTIWLLINIISSHTVFNVSHKTKVFIYSSKVNILKYSSFLWTNLQFPELDYQVEMVFEE